MRVVSTVGLGCLGTRSGRRRRRSRAVSLRRDGPARLVTHVEGVWRLRRVVSFDWNWRDKKCVQNFSEKSCEYYNPDTTLQQSFGLPRARARCAVDFKLIQMSRISACGTG
ncbi:hypothetical protein L798_14245 [Zootermopsis nevadensis]|uniref:Uncharacterized protein n=1 Tax=Zootermopsis nevadensis TaxID=136037 RepID=A0A067QQZ1_ZOONE|nr:hypothetical protein L798_14245 [Zootermopsis nevadensis]